MTGVQTCALPIFWRIFQDHGCSACATIVRVEAVGLRELRQNASELVRRLEEGEEIVITVAGRPGARLVPAAWANA